MVEMLRGALNNCGGSPSKFAGEIYKLDEEQQVSTPFVGNAVRPLLTLCERFGHRLGVGTVRLLRANTEPQPRRVSSSISGF